MEVNKKGATMPELFCDTSGWGHLVDCSQVHHSLAASLYRQARQEKRKVITTNYIVAEFVALMTSPLRLPRIQIIEVIEGLKLSPHVEVVHIDAGIDDQAWQLLKAREDKEWSLVDCASFVLMQQRGISQALTTDRHFEQAGFVRLLRP